MGLKEGWILQRKALANALAAAPSMWTIGNTGMGALQDLKLIKRYKKKIQSCTRSRKKQKQFSSTSKKRQKHRKQVPMQPSTLANMWQTASSTRRKKKLKASPPWQKPKAFT